MKKIYLILMIAAASIVFMCAKAKMNNNNNDEINSSKSKNTYDTKATLQTGNKKILVVYFSHTGSTREIANQIQKSINGDIFEIKAVKTYSDDYEEVKKQAKDEMNSGEKPELKTKIDNINSYDVIFIGYPIWWGTFPAPVKTFLTQYDLKGKTIVPFNTHLGSGLGNSVSDIKKLCPGSTILEAIAIWGKDVKTGQSELTKWLTKIKILN